MAPGESTVVLYDGVCGLCNRLVRFALAHDRREELMFAPLESAFGHAVVERHPALRGHDSIVFVHSDARGELVATRSDAVVHISAHLTWWWRAVGRAYGWLPRAARDGLYEAVARRRYAWFGRYEACPIPTADERRRFIGLEQSQIEN